MTSCALWNDHSKSTRYDDNSRSSKTATATSIAVVIFLIIASTSMALTYIRLHVEQNKLNAEINTITGNMAIRNKEIDNLQVRLEHLKGQEVMRFAPRLGLVPPALGQVTRLGQFRSSNHSIGSVASATARNQTHNDQPGVSNIP
ncbi:MAG: hypothetical protein PHT80_06985 [Lentisphaeria bacterium]|nr:hypothetical protein [Lentisphaeria bacterium]